MADELEDFLEDEEGDEQPDFQAPAEDRGNSSAFAALRQQLKAEKKARKQAEEELTGLRPLREQIRSQQAKDALKSIGLPEAMAGTFARVFDGEMTEENTRAWAQANGLVAPVSEQEQEPAAQTFVPTVGGEAPGPKQMSWDEFVVKLNDPSTNAAALKAFDEGRVASR